MIKQFPGGLTIKELKEILRDWPEEDEYGEAYSVWIETGWCISNEVKEVSQLNKWDILFL